MINGFLRQLDGRAVTSGVLLLSLLLSACVSVTPETTGEEPLSDNESPRQAQAPTAPERYSQFEPETLYALMVAEIAATRQQYSVTLNNYIEQAEATGDLGIIARATRLAQYFRAHQETLDMGELWLAQTPEDIEANAMVATAYLELRKPLQALDHAETILPQLTADDEDDKKSAALLETIANYSRDLDTLTQETLISRYQQLINTYPSLTPIKVGLSTLYEAQQDTAAAYRVIADALAQDPDYLPAIVQEIQLLQASEQTDKALAKLKALLDRRPDDNRLRLLYARLLTRSDINAAYEEFTRLSEQAPQQLDIKFSRALIALELKKLAEAESLLKQLLALNYRPNAINFYLGSLAELNKDNEAALAYYLSVTGGQDYVAAHSRGARIMAQQGDVAAAQNHFSELRETSPDKRAELYSAEAEVLNQAGERDKAIEILTQGVNEQPDNTNLRYDRSTLYEKSNQLALMESDLRHILNLEPENATALNALGYFLTSRTDRHQEALVLITKALELRPKDPAIIDSMGWALFKLGRTEEAISYLRQAFALFPDPEVAAHLGEALWVNGNKQEARTIWQNNLKDNPESDFIIDTMQRLNAQ